MAVFFWNFRKDVLKASIVPRRHSLGVVYSQPREELFTDSKEKLLADIKVSLAGYATEKMRFGTTSDGVAADFRNLMKTAHDMVWKYGMSDSGLVGDYTVIPEHQLSERLKQDLNAETEKIFKSCLKEVNDLLGKEKELLERFVKALMAKD